MLDFVPLRLVVKRLFVGFFLFALLLAGAGAAWGWWWLAQPLRVLVPVGSDLPLEFHVRPGSSARAVAETVTAAGADVPPVLLHAWFRLSGEGRQIKAGSYEIKPGTTPRGLLGQLVRGEQALRSITLIEGWNVREVLAAVRRSPDLTQDLDGLEGEALMARLGYPGHHPEGRFFPDTYRTVRHAPASSVLRQAAQAMEQRLALAWAQRDTSSPLKSPQEALILASIIEKETGRDADRAMVGSVFINRIRIGMRLQTDPTVIYGIGKDFDGNLRRTDLQTDTPYNTYTRGGLPPTPIAMPGWASLLAAVQPARSNALYFVARGDGSSQFSTNLADHNAAVRTYQLRR